MILGGAQENTLLTVEGLDARSEYEAELFSGVDYGREGDLLPRAAETTRLTVIKSLARPVRPLRDARAFWELLRLIRKGNFDIVHTHSWKAGVLGRAAAWFAGTPIVIHTFHGLTFHDHQPWMINWAIRVSEKVCAWVTHHFISVSEITSQKAVEAGICSYEDLTTIYSGMELDWYLNCDVDPKEIRNELGIPEGAPVVGKIARIAPQKNHDELLKAVPAIVREHPNVRFLLIGSGELHEKFEAEVKDLGFGDNFVFAGVVPRERIPEMIAAMDVVAHTALWEGLPRVLPQAMAMGKPCVSFNTDGTPEVLIQDETGYMVERHDSATLASTVVRLLSDAELRTRIGDAARAHVDPMFRAETMVSEISDVYQRMAASYPERLSRRRPVVEDRPSLAAGR